MKSLRIEGFMNQLLINILKMNNIPFESHVGLDMPNDSYKAGKKMSFWENTDNNPKMEDVLKDLQIKELRLRIEILEKQIEVRPEYPGRTQMPYIPLNYDHNLHYHNNTPCRNNPCYWA